MTEDDPGPAASRTSAAGNCQKITSKVAAPVGNRMGRYPLIPNSLSRSSEERRRTFGDLFLSADSTEEAHPVRGKRPSCSTRRGPPSPREEAHPTGAKRRWRHGHAEAVLGEGFLGSFLRMEAPLRVMRCA